MTPNDFRRQALILPETAEGVHMDHPDFRVQNKIFATLWPEEKLGVVLLKPQQQKAFTEIQPNAFTPVQGYWGRKGSTYISLPIADQKLVALALQTAWSNKAPKGLLALLQSPEPG